MRISISKSLTSNKGVGGGTTPPGAYDFTFGNVAFTFASVSFTYGAP